MDTHADFGAELQYAERVKSVNGRCELYGVAKAWGTVSKVDCPPRGRAGFNADALDSFAGKVPWAKATSGLPGLKQRSRQVRMEESQSPVFRDRLSECLKFRLTAANALAFREARLLRVRKI